RGAAFPAMRAQLLAHLVHAPGDRILGNAEFRRRFLVAEALARHEHDGGAQVRRKLRQEALQPALPQEVAPVARLSAEGGEGRECFAHSPEARFAAAVVTTGIDGDADEPGGEARLT